MPALSPPELNALVGLARGVVRGPARRPPFRWWLKRCYLERRSTRAYVAAAFFAVAALSALAVLDGLLAGMHIEGDAAFGVAALSDAGLDPPPVGRPGDVAETWARWTVDGYPEPEHLALAHVFLDTFVFMPAYGWLLGVGLLRLALQFQDHVVIGPPTREERLVQRLARSFRRITVTAFAAVPLLLLVDLIENVLIAGTALECIVSSAPDGCHERPLTYELWAATSVKWLLFAAVAVPLASGLMARELFANGRGLDLGGVLLRLRAVAVIAVVIGMAYLWTATPFAEQAADLLRRWKDELRHAAIAVALTGWWSLLLLLSARCLLERDPSPRGRVPQ